MFHIHVEITAAKREENIVFTHAHLLAIQALVQPARFQEEKYPAFVIVPRLKLDVMMKLMDFHVTSPARKWRAVESIHVNQIATKGPALHVKKSSKEFAIVEKLKKLELVAKKISAARAYVKKRSTVETINARMSVILENVKNAYILQKK